MGCFEAVRYQAYSLLDTARPIHATRPIPIMTERTFQVLRLIVWVYLRREKWLNPGNINHFRGYGHVIVGLHVHPVSWGRVKCAGKA